MTKSSQTSNGTYLFSLMRCGVLLGIQFLLISPLLIRGQSRLTDLEPLQTLDLSGETHHVQGIEGDGRQLWITAVDREKNRGLLFQYELPEKEPRQAIEIHEGSRYHPGGISADGDTLWIPVAEYVRNSTATVQQRDKQTLQLRYQFEVADHIGAIAVVPEGLLGANWDARDFYIWDKQGRQLRKFANPHPVAIQDMKFLDGKLVVGGLVAEGAGVIDWLEWPSLQRTRRITTGRTDRGVVYTNEGMTILDGKLWLLPEDAPSRLFIFRLPK